jgi:hypothetical protein
MMVLMMHLTIFPMMTLTLTLTLTLMMMMMMMMMMMRMTPSHQLDCRHCSSRLPLPNSAPFSLPWQAM